MFVLSCLWLFFRQVLEKCRVRFGEVWCTLAQEARLAVEIAACFGKTFGICVFVLFYWCELRILFDKHHMNIGCIGNIMHEFFVGCPVVLLTLKWAKWHCKGRLKLGFRYVQRVKSHLVKKAMVRPLWWCRVCCCTLTNCRVEIRLVQIQPFSFEHTPINYNILLRYNMFWLVHVNKPKNQKHSS